MKTKELITTHIRIEAEKLRRIIINATDEDMAQALRTVAMEYDAKQS